MRTAHFDFSDQLVIVTGASSGIGRGIAFGFGTAGATVINADVREAPKDPDAQRPTHEKIEADGGTAAFVETDVSEPGEIRSLLDTADDLGGVDVMVNNAGINYETSFHEVTEEQFDQIYGVNVKGAFFGCVEASKQMIRNDTDGTIVNVASVSSNIAQDDLVHYESSKGAVKMITRGTAATLRDHDIRVNAVAPGQIVTEIREGRTKSLEEGENEFLKPILLERLGYPEDVADAVLYLASDAASYTTGELLHVDGGWQAI